MEAAAETWVSVTSELINALLTIAANVAQTLFPTFDIIRMLVCNCSGLEERIALFTFCRPIPVKSIQLELVQSCNFGVHSIYILPFFLH